MISKFSVFLSRVSNALAWRMRKVLGDQRIDRFLVKLAQGWRPVLRRPVFIGIAGSAGKTTAKELLYGILTGGSVGVANPGTLNVLPEIAKTILRTLPTHAFCISELSEDHPGAMDDNLGLFRPKIAIVTLVQDDHLAAFDSREALANELAKLVQGLPSDGVAVLNADDTRVSAMASKCRARVLTFGLSPTAELRAENVESNWPNRLRMTLIYKTDQVFVQTQLCGIHWLPSVLGAMGGALATGLDLSECAKRLEGVAPFEGRMQPVETPEGVTFIRDDIKAPLWAFTAFFDFIHSANASRKLLVIGEVSEIGNAKKADVYRRIAIRAQEVADITVFVGPWAFSVLNARKSDKPEALHAFSRVRDAAAFINSSTRKGDLVFLKGNVRQDHFLRILLDRTESTTCWRDDCQRNIFCDSCPDRLKPSGQPVSIPKPLDSKLTIASVPFAPAVDGAEVQLIVGLGNHDDVYSGTPHNVGFEAVDSLAQAWGLSWRATPNAWIASGIVKGQPVCLVKLRSDMNLTGGGLRQVADAMGIGPERCILVFDDLATPLGKVRTRTNGGAGGHRGVASALEAFQTNDIRRVKLGIGNGTATFDRPTYVTSKFSDEGRKLIDLAIPIAHAQITDLLMKWPLATPLQSFGTKFKASDRQSAS